MRMFIPCLLLFLAGPAGAGEAHVLVQSGTTLQDSGFFEAVLPEFAATHGIEVRVVAVGTGQAIHNARRGDGDLLFTHSPPDEARFVAEGHGIERRDVMYNRFVLVGPAADPAGIDGSTDVVASFARIARSGAPFVSRGDDSGTHKAELGFWRAAGVDLEAGDAAWYRSLGSGMGATLQAGIAMGAYLLADEASWHAFAGRRRDHRILTAGDPRMLNQYGVVLVRPRDGEAARLGAARRFFDWLLSAAGQTRIACFRVAGRQAYVPNAGPEVACGDG